MTATVSDWCSHEPQSRKRSELVTYKTLVEKLNLSTKYSTTRTSYIHSSLLKTCPLAGLPLDTNNERNLPIDGVVGDLASCTGDRWLQEDLWIDVQGYGSTAWRPNNRGKREIVNDFIVAIDWTMPCCTSWYLAGLCVYHYLVRFRDEGLLDLPPEK